MEDSCFSLILEEIKLLVVQKVRPSPLLLEWLLDRPRVPSTISTSHVLCVSVRVDA